MGSEMCIRDSERCQLGPGPSPAGAGEADCADRRSGKGRGSSRRCLLYTSDAADERSSVDLGGRRIIKKKKSEQSGYDGIVYKKRRARSDVELLDIGNRTKRKRTKG